MLFIDNLCYSNIFAFHFARLEDMLINIQVLFHLQHPFSYSRYSPRLINELEISSLICVVSIFLIITRLLCGVVPLLIFLWIRVVFTLVIHSGMPAFSKHLLISIASLSWNDVNVLN